MNVTLEQLLALLGGKEVDLFLLRQEITALKQRIAELEPKPDAMTQKD